MEKRIIYFERAGKINTEETLRLAKKRALELGINHMIIASTHGNTAQKALEILKDTKLKLIIVGSNRESFSKNSLEHLGERGVSIRFSNEVDYLYPELVRNAFKKISEGVKVCVEICMVTVEEGLVPDGKEVIVVAGTSPLGFENGGGADTALVIIPKKSGNFKKLPEKAKRREIKEIICKPR